MKLTNQQIKEQFEALTRLLDGRPRAVLIDGKQQIINEPYSLSAKARWNAAKNRSILRRLKETIDEQFESSVRDLRTFRSRLPIPIPTAPEDQIKSMAADNQAKLEAETDRVNVEFGELLHCDNEVEGLLKIPAAGLGDVQKNAYGAFLDPLMPLLDGEPDFGEKKEKQPE